MVFMSDDVRKRHTVRPGLTGLAQVSGRNNITWEEKFAFDLKYMEKITFFGDIKIIFRTIGKVFKADGVDRDGTVSDVDFGDWLLLEGKIDKEIYAEKQSEANDILKDIK